MKKYLVLLFIFCVNLSHADLWTQKTAIAGMNVSFTFSFTIGTKGYFGSGWKNLAPMNEFWEYNPSIDAWTQKADFAGPLRWTAQGFSIGDKGYAGLGCSQSYFPYDDFWEYDTTANSWTQKASLPAAGRFVPTAFSIGNYGYYFGGFTSGPITDELWQYDPVSDTWTQKTSLGIAMGDAQCFVIGNESYVVGGLGGGYQATNWQYDPFTNAWTQKANYPSAPFCDGATFSLCGLGYVITGETGSSNFTNETWQYDPVLNQWTQKTNFPGPARDESTYFSVGDKGYIGYGANQGWSTGIFFNDFWEYTPDNPCSAGPTAIFSSSNTVCPGTCINFNNLSLNATSYQWNFPGASPDTSTAINPVNICYYTPGNYNVSLIASNATVSDTLLLQNYITVFPYPMPQGISQSGDTLFAIAGAVSYQWYYNGNIINGATDYFYPATQNGNYNVICTDNNGCEVEAVIFDVMVDVPAVNANDGEFIMFPNPVENKLTVEMAASKSGSSEMSIYNMIGEKMLGNFSDDQIFTVDCQFLPAGIYFIEITATGKSYRAKFTKL